MNSRINKILSFVRTLSNGAKVTDVEIDLGGGDNRTARHFSAPGDDSFPLKTDYALSSDVAPSGNQAVHGYIDPINDSVALEGDKRIYGRDPSDGSPVNQVWLKSDGSVLVSNNNGSMLLSPDGSIKGDNGNGSFELEVAGDFVVNNVTITPAGDISTPTVISSPSIIADGKELTNHDHSITWTDPAGSGTSGPNN